MIQDRSAWPASTTFIAGCCLGTAASAALLASSPFTDPVLVELDRLGFLNSLWSGVSLLTAAGFIVLAIGARGELGAAGTSRLGALGLGLYGCRHVLEGLLPSPPEDAAPFALLLAQVLSDVLFATTAALFFIAAAKVVAADVLGAAARWLLLATATASVFLTLRILLPGTREVPILRDVHFDQLLPLLTLAFATGCLLHGRTEALRHRLRPCSSAAVAAAWAGPIASGLPPRAARRDRGSRRAAPREGACPPCGYG